MASDIIKFRVTNNEDESIKRTVQRFGLNNDSAAIRILLSQGEKAINDFFEHARIVTQPLKYSEIDFFTSSLNVYLKKQKKDSETPDTL